ncbi:hypothetical protein IE077_000379, partial [Cardiosporidium cionae]
MEDLSHFLSFVVKSALSSSALLHSIAIQAAGLLASHKFPVYSLLFEFLDSRLQKLQEITSEILENGVNSSSYQETSKENKSRRIPPTERSRATCQIYRLLEFCSNLISCHAHTFCKSYQDLERLVALPCDRLLRIVPETLSFLMKEEISEDFLHQNLRIAAEIVNYYHLLIRERSQLDTTYAFSLGGFPDLLQLIRAVAAKVTDVANHKESSVETIIFSFQVLIEISRMPFTGLAALFDLPQHSSEQVLSATSFLKNKEMEETISASANSVVRLYPVLSRLTKHIRNSLQIFEEDSSQAHLWILAARKLVILCNQLVDICSSPLAAIFAALFENTRSIRWDFAS